MTFTESGVLAGLVLALSGVVLGQDQLAVITHTISMSAAEAYEKGLGGAGVQHDFVSNGVMLYDTTLVEDDGEGAGGDARWVAEDERSPMVPVDANSQVKKLLWVDRPECLEAILYVRPGKAIVEFNGRPVDTSHSDKFHRVPVELVRRGENEVVVRAEGDTTAGIKLALRQHILESNPELRDRPPRSFRSADGGKTWQPLDGELTIRLHLTQYPAEGSFISPVMDLARTESDPLGLAKVELQSLRLSHEAQTPPGTSVGFAVRFGKTPVYDPTQWSDWLPVTGNLPKDNRFVQWRASLKTTDPRTTPVLREVTLQARVAREPLPTWATQLSVKDFHNEEIRYTSMPFEYEDPNHPRMVALREKYRLAEVVRDGKTELEKLVRLRDWVAHQWKFTPPENHYPAWDAEEILTRKVGMCVQYAITYIQCCNALGYPARYVCGWHPGTMATAHEVSEVWSNEHCKWIFMDPTSSRNELYADPTTGEPLSMLEVHDRMVKHYYGDKPALYANRPAKPSWCESIASAQGLSVVPTEMHKASDPAPDDWPSWTEWLLLYYVPRNNFYAKPQPLPRCQGWNSWDWTGFWSWYDPQTYRDWRYRYFASRRADVQWTINQVCFAASFGDKPYLLTVSMGTITPNFDTFLVNVDGQGWQPSAAQFSWLLHPGRNRLEMRVRNTSGVVGPVSFIEVERTT